LTRLVSYLVEGDALSLAYPCETRKSHRYTNIYLHLILITLIHFKAKEESVCTATPEKYCM